MYEPPGFSDKTLSLYDETLLAAVVAHLRRAGDEGGGETSVRAHLRLQLRCTRLTTWRPSRALP